MSRRNGQLRVAMGGPAPRKALPVLSEAAALELEALLEKVYRERGFDFREYRESTLIRRIGRRLRATGSADYGRYADLLDQNPHEYETLFNDLTINVTRFFRDKPAFSALETVVFPELIHGTEKESGEREIRIWSAGCATGEEVYSVAILLLECLGSGAKRWKIRVLGSDLDPEAVQKASHGFFTKAGVTGLNPKRLGKYFSKEGEGFRVKESLRRLVRFETHSLMAEPPCAGQDLVLCRNVLIYFTPTLQAQALEHLHKGLRHGGFLLLGKAEVPVGEARGLFKCADKKAKLYRMRSAECGVRNKRMRNAECGMRNGRSSESPDGRHKEKQKMNGTTQMKNSAPKPFRIPHSEIRNGIFRNLVVVAASAGGISPLIRLISQLPEGLEAAVLVVQHLSTKRPTTLPELLNRQSNLMVSLAEDGMTFEAGRVYIAEPGKHLLVEGKTLSVVFAERVQYVRPSADLLFVSAARSYGGRVIGVILSGTGKDGTLGCVAIQAKGGVTMAQDEASARYHGMPNNAIEAKAIDYVLSPDQMVDKIVSLVSRKE